MPDSSEAHADAHTIQENGKKWSVRKQKEMKKKKRKARTQEM